MKCMAQEPVLFEDILCQMVDMVGPKLLKLYKLASMTGYFTLLDLKESKLSGSVFNILFNHYKFKVYESRDPFVIHQVSYPILVISLHYYICLQNKNRTLSCKYER
ncbi:hypothetical protein Hanom_Chr00s000001g01595551 [Helianthus anomalus]